MHPIAAGSSTTTAVFSFFFASVQCGAYRSHNGWHPAPPAPAAFVMICFVDLSFIIFFGQTGGGLVRAQRHVNSGHGVNALQHSEHWHNFKVQAGDDASAAQADDEGVK